MCLLEKEQTLLNETTNVRKIKNEKFLLKYQTWKSPPFPFLFREAKIKYTHVPIQISTVT